MCFVLNEYSGKVLVILYKSVSGFFGFYDHFSSQEVCWLFCVNFTQTRITRVEGTSIENETPSPPVPTHLHPTLVSCRPG